MIPPSPIAHKPKPDVQHTLRPAGAAAAGRRVRHRPDVQGHPRQF